MSFINLQIQLESGVLADQYTIVQTFSEPLGTIHSQEILGWPATCSIKKRNYDSRNKKYTLSGDYYIQEHLKEYIVTSFEENATVSELYYLQQLASHMDCSLVNNSDNFYINHLANKVTVLQMLQSLFGWKTNIPHKLVNVCLRGSTVYVWERGKETGINIVPLTGYQYPTYDSTIIDTFMNNDGSKGAITGDSLTQPGVSSLVSTYVSAFGCVLQYENGVCVYEKEETSDFITTTVYVYAENNPRLLVYKRINVDPTPTGNATNRKKEETETRYSYGTLDSQPYLSYSEEIKKVNNIESSKTLTYNVPVGLDFYGQKMEYYSNQPFITPAGTQLGFKWVLNNYTSKVQSGSPPGEATPWTKQQNDRTIPVQVETDRHPISGDSIPVVDLATVELYAAALLWLDGKTQTTCNVTVKAPFIFDFDKKVRYPDESGNLVDWFLDKNTITIDGKTASILQTLDLIRWA